MSRTDYLALGDWNAVCYECGRKFKASELKRHWKGYWVCRAHWEPRETQDFVRAVPDVQAAPWVQPPADLFRFISEVIVTEAYTPTEDFISPWALTTEDKVPLASEGTFV